MKTTTDDTQAYIKLLSIHCTPDKISGLANCTLDYIATVEGEQEYGSYDFVFDATETNGVMFGSALEAARAQHVV